MTPHLTRRSGLLFAFILLLITMLALAVVLANASTQAGAAGTAYVRINQVGYIGSETKQAILMASGSESGATFKVVTASGGQSVYSAAIGASKGSWSSNYPDTYLLDFSTLQTSGSYQIKVSGSIAATSPTFKIDSASNLYTSLTGNALFYYEAQKDGPDVNTSVLNRQPSHLTDEQAHVYNTPTYDSNDVLQGSLTQVGGPVDVSGGWFDAGDYLKFVETASYTDAALLLAAREYPNLNTGAYTFSSEGKYGLDWLQKMWDNTNKILYYQVGIGDGNGGSILGDHDYWRLPQADDQMSVSPGDAGYYVKYRPVFRIGAGGSAISPNLAGRVTADFALCYQLFSSTNPAYANQCLVSAENVYALAKTTNVGQLVTTAPYDYYPETSWHDDMELGATELYYALAKGNLPSGLVQTDPTYYLKQAATWASDYISSDSGSDSLNLYDTSGLAHYELYNAIAQAGTPSGLAVSQASLLSNLKSQVDIGVTQATKDPFGLGIAYAGADAAPHALGLSLEATEYDQLTSGATYQNFAETERNWLLGSNAWGSSFVVGAGSTYPHCMQNQVANLSGSLDGSAPLMLGAIPDGPNASSSFSGLSLQDGMRACPVGGGDAFSAFNGKSAKYVDNVTSWPSSEPADDYVVLSTLVFAAQSGSASTPTPTPTATSTPTPAPTSTPTPTPTATSTPTPTPTPVSGGIVNGGFETGDFTGWSRSGTTSISGTKHGGSHSAELGTNSPTNGDSSISQTFTASSGTTTLSFYYDVRCPDDVTYDWATAKLKDNTTGTTTTILAKTCTNATTWVKVSASITAGHSYTLTLTSHDENNPGDPTYTLYDDVALN